MGLDASRTRLGSLVLSCLLLPLSILVFALGFFPYKPLLPGLALFDTHVAAGLQHVHAPEPAFERVVFMVVDALRSDFVFGNDSGFAFTQSLIRKGAALPFTAFAAPPTVTMPRIKALTTGSVPSFADLIFNLDESDTGSSLAGQDTWLAQIRAKGGKLIFYGDDTWLRLFPGEFFARSEGTSSFFVSDFTEVDNNVTRHIPGELERADWNAMIVHYLGLDHIGHKTGPQGPNMLPKQREMDGIVQHMYRAMEEIPHQQNTLLVLAGDHGMNAGGNHGGSGPGETEPALVFISPKFQRSRETDQNRYQCPTSPKEGTEFHYYRKVQQSDLVPTLAALMQFPIPKNSLGVVIHEVAELWSSRSSVARVLYDNAQQMKRIVEAKLGIAVFASQVLQATEELRRQDAQESTGVDSLAARLVLAEHEIGRSAERNDFEASIAALSGFLEHAQDFLSNVASLYNIPQMITGIGLAAASVVLALVSLPSLKHLSLAGSSLGSTCLLYGVMMFASSYVEEEQHFWYWLTPAWTALLAVRAAISTSNKHRRSEYLLAAVAILAVHRFAIRWNQTGQKHSGEPDIAHSFFPQNHVLMWILILITYGYTGFQIMWTTLADLVSREIAATVGAALILPALGFKLNFTQADAPELVQGLAGKIRRLTQGIDLVGQAQIAFLLLGLVTVAVIGLALFLAKSTVINSKNAPAIRTTLPERLHHLLTLFLITQSRTPNIPLFTGLEIQRRALRVLLTLESPPKRTMVTPGRNANVSPTQLALSTLLLSQVYFFCMGGSNSISSVDLSNAYNGVGDYNIFAVGILLFSSNWTGPIWWCSAAVLMTFSQLDTSRAAQAEDRKVWIEAERTKLKHDAQAALPEDQTRSGLGLWFVYVAAMTVFVGTSLLAIMVTCTVLRTHLFIWTVFSPKYLYAMAWCVGWHLLINIGLGSSLRLLGQVA